MHPLRELFAEMVGLARLYTSLFGMSKLTVALIFKRAGTHGRAEIVSLPPGTPAPKSGVAGKVCMGNHDKAVPVAAESLDNVRDSVADLWQSMTEGIHGLTSRLEALTMRPLESGTTNDTIVTELRAVQDTVNQIAKDQERRWRRPGAGNRAECTHVLSPCHRATHAQSK